MRSVLGSVPKCQQIKHPKIIWSKITQIPKSDKVQGRTAAVEAFLRPPFIAIQNVAS